MGFNFKLALVIAAGILALAQRVAVAQSADPSAAPPASDLPPPVVLTPAVEVPFPRPGNVELLDIPNDETQIGIAWVWDELPQPGDVVTIEAQPSGELLDQFELTDEERNRLSAARQRLAEGLAPLLPQLQMLAEAFGANQEALTTLENSSEKDAPGYTDQLDTARNDYWESKGKLEDVQAQIDRLADAFARTAGKLALKARQHEYLSSALGASQYLMTDASGIPAEALTTKGAAADVLGDEPADPDKLFVTTGGVVAPAPAVPVTDYALYNESPPPAERVPFSPGENYVLRMAVQRGDTVRYFDLGAGQAKRQLFNGSLANGLVLAVVFGCILLAAIFLARKNPDRLFIRRIAGLEAVDEAIGRATEMGKPVLYLNGMNDLTDLSTIASINILGRVARKIAFYDSELLVPTRDPVVMTVAQEVVREGYMDAGRPDAYREDNIFFVTQDQFSYTTTTCGIMLREKPAANFFMGYYYAESLLLAETGQRTGAIQIAGTDSQNQLPFFITTCDYTLIGEELYAASAYLSREPMLLGSLKGLDVAKLLLILMLLLQTILFLIAKASGDPAGLDFIRKVFEPR